jgi:two-component system copper resistance phosphate regulon response regulator CusR
MTSILIAEDEVRISQFIDKGLRAEGFATTIAEDGTSALDLALTDQFDLMILDLGLPELDGIDVLQRLRGSGSRIPVIILTARRNITDTVQGLEQGANDYMVKPFQFAELMARVRLRLREADSTTAVGADADVITFGQVSLDLRTRRVRVQDTSHELTAREFTLVETFLRHAGQVLSREQLLGHAWGYDFDPQSNIVDVYVRTLRRKLGADRIVTVRGMGYRFEP